MKAITGNTYPVRAQIKALGGKWDSLSKAWLVPDDKEEQAKALVAKAVPQQQPLGDSNGQPTASGPCYTKLKNGAWGVRLPGTATVGQTISVVTKAGKTKSEVVEAVLWAGPDKLSGQPIALCSIKGGDPNVCKVCGHKATNKYGDVIYRSGECRDCFEERKMGY